MKTSIFLLLNIFNFINFANADAKSDIDLFLNGEKSQWNSAGHSKARGANFKISYPRTWKALEGARPNVVQKFVSDGGHGMESVMIQIVPLPKPYDTNLTKENIIELTSPEMAKEMTPERSSFLSHELTKVDGELCSMYETLTANQRVGFNFYQRMLHFTVPRNGHLFMISCSMGGEASNGTDAINALYLQYKPLFLLIASSCVFNDKWILPTAGVAQLSPQMTAKVFGDITIPQDVHPVVFQLPQSKQPGLNSSNMSVHTFQHPAIIRGVITQTKFSAHELNSDIIRANEESTINSLMETFNSKPILESSRFTFNNINGKKFSIKSADEAHYECYRFNDDSSIWWINFVGQSPSGRIEKYSENFMRSVSLIEKN